MGKDESKELQERQLQLSR